MIFSPKRTGGFDIREELKRRYADILHMWGLLDVRTSVMKLLAAPQPQHSGLEILLDCQNCGRPVIGSAFCHSCLKFALRCSVCRVLVRGTLFFFESLLKIILEGTMYPHNEFKNPLIINRKISVHVIV